MTYKDDGSGFVAKVTYDGVIGPPAIPLADNDGEDYNNDAGGGDDAGDDDIQALCHFSS